MQTWLVHMRQPKALFDAVGAPGFWGFQFFVGGPCLVFLTAPLLWTIWLISAWSFLPLQTNAFPAWIGPVAAFNLASGVLVHFGMALLAIRQWGWRGMGPALLCYPFYWLLHSVAAYKAVWQLATRPYYWEKTEHGQELPPAAALNPV